MGNSMSEVEFRSKIQSAFDQIQAAFENVDPDIAEAEQALGAMTIQFADRSKCILSAQPSVRQLWVALASEGRAHHFDWSEAQGEWRDDKQPSLDLLSCLREVLRKKISPDFSWPDFSWKGSPPLNEQS